ncbi:MAG: multidrug efflux RND transporter permease subunit [Desulfobacterales bacterium]|nr:multidrug efflux RND transporter permease subunit [Desulfobacterales bacterium]
MKLPHFFIDRPIMATVIAIITVIVGLVAYYTLPVAQYPEVVPPNIVVRTSFPGASPEVIAATVATPLEQEINGVENMLYMTSQSTSDGQLELTITFKLGTDLDEAQVLVQNRVAIAEPRLPDEVRRQGVTVRKRSPDMLMVIHMLSPQNRYDQLYIGNYALIQVKDVLARLDGVGDVSIYGLREYSMRVWLDPERAAMLDITAGDVVRALREQNIQVAAGVLAQPPIPQNRALQLTVNTLGRLTEREQFGEIVIKTGDDGRITRLRDIARVELDARDYSVNSYLDGKPAVAILVFQRPGSNALATARAVQSTIQELSTRFPEGLEHRIVYNPTEFVQKSVDAVIQTIYEAGVLVVAVILLFLQTWRAALIPMLAIPVSLIGTFAVMAALGYSLNNLSLFGLVLAIGIVVDDAIVVVENVERKIEEGLAPRQAAREAMDEVGSALIATSVVLLAVFVPTAFISGISGQFYRQFAMTIAAAMAISTFNSLTLSPALCALLLQPAHQRAGRHRWWDLTVGAFFRGFNRRFDQASRVYTWSIGRVVRRSGIALAVYGGLIFLTLFGFRQVPTGFIPPQDQGYLIVAIQLPDRAALDRTDAVVRQATALINDTPGIAAAVGFAGFSGATRTNASNAAAIFASLDPFDQRAAQGVSAGAITAELRRKLGDLPEALIAVFPPPPVPGLGTAGGFKLQVQDRSGLGLTRLQAATNDLVAAGNDHPGLVGLFTTFRANAPQIYVDVDRAKAKMLDVPLNNVFETLQVYLGSLYVNDFNLFGRTFQVLAQAGGEFRLDPQDIGKLKTRSASGHMVPLGSLVTIVERTGPDRVVRYNMFPAAEINGDTRRGFSSGQAVAAIAALADEVLPAGMGFEWTDLTYQQILAGNTALFIFPLCVLFVFLALAAQYESWSLPLAVILIVPLCLLCAIFGLWLRGMDNNILTQIGFVVLVGLATKNAILIVEFAKDLQEKGQDRITAVIEACRLRLRPIMMTAFSFILGVVPLLVASGAGAEMRQSLGTAVFSGMLGVTFFGLFLTPVFYVVIRWFVERRRRSYPSGASGFYPQSPKETEP